MKPIKLVIKGLNSFIEEQTIDFEKLTDRGLFGIFGSTGSGKSTILDGITLALYGDIARKSSNFINTNCNELSVSFTFQISGSVDHIYIVNRQFKRDKKTGNAKTHSATIRTLTEEGEEIIADSKTTVDRACREILGLSLEDFTRTVVLPQGKFSEFLKLEGKQRREMLERLFNLQEYGESLGQKLSRQMAAEKEKYNQLIGELNAYEEISEDKLHTEKERLEVLSGQLEGLKAKQVEVEARFKEGEEVWKLQKDLKEHKQRQQILNHQAERMKAEEEKMKRGESALKVNPYMESCEKKQQDLVDNQKEQEVLQVNLERLAVEKQQIEVAFEKIKVEKEEKLPQIQSKMQQVAELLEDNKRVYQLEMGVNTAESKEPGIAQIQVGLRKAYQYIEQFKTQEAHYVAEISQITDTIEKNQKEEQSLKVDQVVREQVNEGVKLIQSYNYEKKDYDKNIERQRELQVLKESYIEKLEQLKLQLEENAKQLEEFNLKQETLLKQAPMSQEELLDKKEILVQAKEKWERLDVIRKEMELYLAESKGYEGQYQELQIQTQEKKAAVEKLRDELEKARLEYLAHSLRAQLHEGSPCPVCGSIEHPMQDIEQIQKEDSLNEKEGLLQILETDFEMLQAQVANFQMQLSANAVTIERLKKEQEPLEILFKAQTLEQREKEFATCSQVLQQFEEQKRLLEEEISSTKEARNKIETENSQQQTLLQENQKQLKALEKEIEEQFLAIKGLQEQLSILSQAVQTEDFNMLYTQIKEKDSQREDLLKRIHEQGDIKQKLIDEREKVQGKLNEYKARFEVGLTKFDAKQKNKQELLMRMGSRIREILELKEESQSVLEAKIRDLLGFLNEEKILKAQLKGELGYESILGEGETGTEHEINLMELENWYVKYPLLENRLEILQVKLQAIDVAMKETVATIESQFVQTEMNKNKVDTAYDTTSKKFLEVKASIQGLDKQLKEELIQLENQLRDEHLTKEEVRLYLLTKEQIDVLKQNISQYREDCAKLIGAIDAVRNKLGERKLELEEWNALQEEKLTLSNEMIEMMKQHTNLTTLVNSIEEALKRLGKLREEKQKLDHKMAILTDLDKLFKGKRFVEFVAATRLKYVSLEASKKLKEITNGNYGLEVDEGGKFIIRDYKNGGAQRDASTLSGGETFLASLALALALSAEIQLKGTAPLELFFLDEGFGTLDDELLEVVMGSLERIHHDKLKVGIISHVEAIKNRVPVKLLLTPAESGRGGTKVKLERS